MGMSFFAETETFLIGCWDGNIYTYNLSNKMLKNYERHASSHITAITFINSVHYAFSSYDCNEIYVGDLENGDVLRFKNNFPHSLESLPKRSLLFSFLDNGFVTISRTDQLPKLPILNSVQGILWDSSTRKILSIKINGKDFVLTTGDHFTIKIWNLTKGKMRLIKVIYAKERVYSMVYLEDCQMIATTHNTGEIKFFRLMSGKLECTLDVDLKNCQYVFLMKDKNALGAVGWGQNIIKIVQLSREHGCKD